jgi:hypothetical protein
LHDHLEQAWAILRCMVSMIYLNMKALAVWYEILHIRWLYSLKINSGTKNFFGPSRDLQMDFIGLVKDLGLFFKEKNSNILFLTNFGSLIPNLNRKKNYFSGLAQKWAPKWQGMGLKNFFYKAYQIFNPNLNF